MKFFPSLVPNLEPGRVWGFERRLSVAQLAWQSAGIEHRVACGFREWKKGEASWGNTGTKESMAASGAWTLPDTYVMKQCFTQTPYHLTTKFRFEDDRVFVDEETNVAFGSTKRPQLVGRAE